ncbi:DUF2292 domain-containing protein [Alkalihalophilus pseudofirmus]|uniref:YezD family protein n=1 Tax=Alkalihalophilus pseudofirmus TaxID=79885 RepID=UPI00259B4522|nr:DUF2292 domain-containing protein [Alkalihalophilus pseudofirmus]WEG17893.1 DUF2292 domain-containing protein [Alkalihalophilus pseudofirmus]
MSTVDGEKLTEITKALQKIAFGSVVITIHDGQITQIDATEKIRFVQQRKKK